MDKLKLKTVMSSLSVGQKAVQYGLRLMHQKWLVLRCGDEEPAGQEEIPLTLS